MTRITADAAIGAILIFVAWCAAQAIAPDAPVGAELDEPVYAVLAPVEVTQPARRLAARQVTTTVPPPRPEHYDTWLQIAQCESGGDWTINTGNSYYGGLQFSLTSWRGAGGTVYATYPHQASALEQMWTAERLLDMQGWGAWPTCARKLGLR